MICKIRDPSKRVENCRRQVAHLDDKTGLSNSPSKPTCPYNRVGSYRPLEQPGVVPKLGFRKATPHHVKIVHGLLHLTSANYVITVLEHQAAFQPQFRPRIYLRTLRYLIEEFDSTVGSLRLTPA